ncbi:hypothetical protein F4778DRAFT_105363 [Xylariomycetidae sp. FL2044]|nr:hypothetical protein F4778DRAFT_105363 [Xylariomycetidae sp. FL2044]
MMHLATLEDTVAMLGVDIGKVDEIVAELQNRIKGVQVAKGKGKGPRKSLLPQAQGRRQDFFTRLPPELRLCVIPFIRTKDLGSLRLASRVMAEISSLEELGKTDFWRMRFCKEYPFMVPATAVDRGNSIKGRQDRRKWRAAYLCNRRFFIPFVQVNNYWNHPFFPRNHQARRRRRRVWVNLAGVTGLVGRTCQGEPMRGDTEWLALQTEAHARWNTKPSSVKLVWATMPTLYCVLNNTIVQRFHIYRRLPWITRDMGLRTIGVTIGALGNSLHFVSGIRLVHAGRGSPSSLDRFDEIGYPLRSAETKFQVAAAENICGIKVSHTGERIVGLRFMLRNEKTGKTRSTDWAQGPLKASTVTTQVQIHRRYDWVPFTLIGCFDVSTGSIHPWIYNWGRSNADEWQYCGLIGLSLVGEGLSSDNAGIES